MIIDYTVAVECENPEVYYTCWQCGKCGRKFENGFMIDDGGTTIDEEEQRQVRNYAKNNNLWWRYQNWCIYVPRQKKALYMRTERQPDCDIRNI